MRASPSILALLKSKKGRKDQVYFEVAVNVGYKRQRQGE